MAAAKRAYSQGPTRHWASTMTGLEPGAGFVLAVFVAEVGFEDAGLGASTQELHGEDEEKGEQVVRLVEK